MSSRRPAALAIDIGRLGGLMLRNTMAIITFPLLTALEVSMSASRRGSANRAARDLWVEMGED
jgi:hypothetical protein